MERTTIMLEKPVLDKVREKARMERKSLREVLHEVIVAGLRRTAPQVLQPLDPGVLGLGREKVDIASRARLYEIFETDS